MQTDVEKYKALADLCAVFRRDVIDQLYRIQTGHPGGSLSCCEILTTLYFARAKLGPEYENDPDRDWLVLCKGHAAPMLYRILAEKRYFPLEDFATLRQIGSHLQGHPSSLHTPGVDISTGPLGIGYSAALGIALAARKQKKTGRVYAVLGDGEINEGVVWETAMIAAKYQADNLIAIVDRNHVQLDGTSDDIMPLFDLAAKWRAFGNHVISCDGHDIAALDKAFEEAGQVTGKPVVILAETVKGKGVSFMEGQNIWHGKAISSGEYERASAELGRCGA